MFASHLCRTILLPQLEADNGSMNLFRSKFDGNARKERLRGRTLSDKKKHAGNPQQDSNKVVQGGPQIICQANSLGFSFKKILLKDIHIQFDLKVGPWIPKIPEALRGFDAPVVFNQGLKAPLVEVADQEVPGPTV